MKILYFDSAKIGELINNFLFVESYADQKRVIIISNKKKANKLLLKKLQQSTSSTIIFLPKIIIKFLNKIISLEKYFEKTISIHNFPAFFIKRNTFFSIKENNKGLKFLSDTSLEPDRPIIVFYIRDEIYLKNHLPNFDWTYHDYRNSSALEYIEIITLFINLGYAVIRMGNLAKDKLPLKNPNFLDYPFWNLKSDFLDVWIPSISAGMVSTGTGPDTLAILFNKPLMHLNFLPAYSSFYNHKVLVVPKLLRVNGGYLDLDKNLSTDLTTSKDFAINEISYENFPSSLFGDVVNEFLFFINNKFQNKRIEQLHAEKVLRNVRQKHHIWSNFHESAKISNTWINYVQTLN